MLRLFDIRTAQIGFGVDSKAYIYIAVEDTLMKRDY